MSVFADSSALVKLYADEVGHERIRALEAIAIAQIARVEVPAALWRKQRMGELDAGHARLLTSAFEADYFGTDDEQPRFAAVRISSAILDDAAQCCATRSLRAHDGVQLACAVAARRADPGCTAMAVFDQVLRQAAAAEGFDLIPAVSAAAPMS